MKLFSILEGLALGAGLMYVMDPELGKKRRSMARDQAQKQLRVKQEALGVMQRDFTNRTRGMVTAIKANRTMGDVASDEIIEQRLKSALGRACSHPRAIHPDVQDGEVTLNGHVLSDEVQAVVQCAKHVRGVHKVTNNLDVVEDASSVPSLQGGTDRNNRPTTWNPATSLVMTTAGGLMSLYGIARRGPVGLIMSFVGMGVVTKAFWDTEHRFMPRERNNNSLPQGQQTGAVTEEYKQPESIGSYEGVTADRDRSIPISGEDVDVI